MIVPQPAIAATGSVLVDESFASDSVSDSRWLSLGDACLTAAAAGSTPPSGASNLSACRNTQDTAYLTGKPGGYLQLTDNSGSRTSNVLFDRAIPSRAGLDISFYQFQFATSGTGLGPADGIGFFLTDGSYTLERPGPTGAGFGGALGYASIEDQPGLANAALGIGLDVYGNFSRQPYVGTACTTNHDRTPNAVVLRDGAAADYCIATDADGSPASVSGQALRTDAPANVPVGEEASQPGWRLINIRVSPTTDENPFANVTVSINGSTIIDTKLESRLPSLVKMGFSSSTGGGHEAHLVRALKVQTVDALGNINLVKAVDRTEQTGTTRTAFTVGDVIPYTFTVTNPGADALKNIVVTDETFSDMTVTCPATTLDPADSMTCHGSHTVTASDLTEDGKLVAAKDLNNAASVAGNTVTDNTPVADTSNATAPLYTGSASWKKVDQSGEAVAPTTWTLAGPNSYSESVLDNIGQDGYAGLDEDPAAGAMKVSGLPGGTYTLTEIAAPAGYELASGVTTLPTIDESTRDVSATSPIVNTKQSGILTWSKTDSATGTALEGSEWSLIGPEGPESATVVITDNGDTDTDPNAGTLRLDGLKWGEYVLTETKAPLGYKPLTSGIPVTITGQDLNVDLGAIENTALPTPTPSPTPTPTPSPIPTPTPSPIPTPGSGLATTGADGGTVLAAATAALVVMLIGAGLIRFGRRRITG